MANFILTWLLTAVALIFTAHLVPGFKIDSFGAAAIAAIVLGLVNAIVRPILILLTLPLTVLTLGLFLLVVNAIVLLIVGAISPGFSVAGFFPALIGSIVLTIISTVLHWILRPE